MNLKIAIICLVLIPVLGSFSSCNKTEQTGNGETFNRALLLDQAGDGLILPAFKRFEESVSALSMEIQAFSDAPSSASLGSSRLAWEKAFMDFQAIRGFTFGPGEQSLIGDINENLGTWPVDTTKVEQRITANDLVMNDFRRDSRGLLTLEYLLFEPNALSRFQGPSSALRNAYLLAVNQDIQNWARTQSAAWLDYLPTFKDDVGKSAGSSTSELYNHWLQNYEGIKNFKLALPAGLRAGQTQPEPGLVESRYAHLSIRSIKMHLDHIEKVWYGEGLDGSAGIGFDDYLDKVEGGPALKEETKAQWVAIHRELDKFPDTDDLAILVTQDPQKVSALLTELQKMTRYLKSDLSSLLGIAITYSSGDGD